MRASPRFTPVRLSKTPLALVALIAALGATSPSGVLRAEDTRPPSANAPIAPLDVFARETRRIADHVWLISKPAPTDAPFEGNTTVIEQANGLVVIDAGGSPHSGEILVQAIRALSRKPVRFVVYTHYHGDHNLGTGALRAAWPALTIVSTLATREHMTSAPMEYIQTYDRSYGEMAEYAAEQAKNSAIPESERAGWSRFALAGPAMRSAYANLRAFPADVTFTDRLTLHDADMPVELAFLGRANTDGDAIAWLAKPRVLVTGDIVVAPVPYASACYPAEWIEVLKKLSA